MCLLKYLSILLMLLLPLISEAAGPIRCLPCTDERMAHCPPVGNTCTEEMVREPGCGCCQMCALSRGQSCGVYTARCATGLRCYPQLMETKPLETLMQGRGICMDIAEVERIQAIQAETQTTEIEIESPSPDGTEGTQAGTNYRFIPASGHSIPDRRNSADAQIGMRARINYKQKQREQLDPSHQTHLYLPPQPPLAASRQIPHLPIHLLPHQAILPVSNTSPASRLGSSTVPGPPSAPPLHRGHVRRKCSEQLTGLSRHNSVLMRTSTGFTFPTVIKEDSTTSSSVSRHWMGNVEDVGVFTAGLERGSQGLQKSEVIPSVTGTTYMFQLRQNQIIEVS
ncbi:insulin-like growth factor-binding protein 4 isoform X1 [Hypanus sabinus]|uniref:insulin-like growth factor-binding protein 4 isoform X1 n=1 Tax=Hypanus sabinus TaxID=79690 RepID=UPI0028C4B719|nr:insulin-like growth factor-binding protein 4 isoform X1 [Hypanus sabinus]